MTAQDANGGRLIDHWVDMPEWGSDRRLWSFYLTFEGVDVLQRRVAALQGRLAGIPGLDLVEQPWLHLTLLGTVFSDEIDEATIEALSRATSEVAAAEAPFQLSATGQEPSHDALLLNVTSDPPLAAFRDRLRAMTERVVDRELYRLPEPLGGFSPHVTIAYARAETWPVARIVERFADGAFPPIRFRVSEVSLVRLRRGSNDWTWDRSFRFPLLGPT